MKKNLKLHKTFLFIKFATITVAGLLNLIGMILMTRGYIYWDTYILYSIFVLMGTIISSYLVSVFEKKVFNESLQTFFANQGMSEGIEVIRKTDQALLVSFKEEQYTVYIERKKEGLGFILTPAQTTVEGVVVNWDGSVNQSEITYLTGWEQPVWKDKEE